MKEHSAGAQDTVSAAERRGSWRREGAHIKAGLCVGAVAAAEALATHIGAHTPVARWISALYVGAWGASLFWIGAISLRQLSRLPARLAAPLSARLPAFQWAVDLPRWSGLGALSATLYALYALAQFSAGGAEEVTLELRALGAVGGGALALTPALLWGAERLARRLGGGAAQGQRALSALLWALWGAAMASEETLTTVREGSASLHAALYVGSALVTWLVTWLITWLTSRRERLACVCLIALSLALALADRYALRGLYEGVHEWLFWTAAVGLSVGLSVGLVGLPVGLSVGLPVGLPVGLGGPLAGSRVAPARTLTPALAFALTLTLALTGLIHQAKRPSTRAAIKSAQLGRHLYELSLRLSEYAHEASRARSEVARDPNASHPALEFDQRLSAPVPAPLRRPHIVLITIDALRSQALHPTKGYMPTLSALAAEGVHFPQAYAAGSRTAIGMTSVHFGRYSRELEWDKWLYQSGSVFSPTSKQGAALIKKKAKVIYTTIPQDPPHGRLAERLRAVGYRTAAAPYAGSNDFFKRGVGFERGFEVFRDLSAVRWPVESGPKVTAEALGALDELLGGASPSRTQPVFVWAHYYDPHESRGKPGRYRELAGVTDQALKALFEGLKARGVLDEALVLVTSDHGEAMKEHGVTGHATDLYEEQVRVPFVLWLGERLRAGLEVEGVRPQRGARPGRVAHVDVAATLLVAAGASVRALSGLNLLPSLLEGLPPPRRAVLSELHRYIGAGGTLSSDLTAVWLDHWKLIVDHRRDEERLFLLSRDPRERDDLAHHVGAADGGVEMGPSEASAAGATHSTLQEVVRAFRARGYPLP